MRLYIFAIALIMAIGLPATVQLGRISNDAAAQEVRKEKKEKRLGRPYMKKGEYRLCRELGGTSWNCGVRLHYWTTRNPNGKVIY